MWAEDPTDGGNKAVKIDTGPGAPEGCDGCGYPFGGVFRELHATSGQLTGRLSLDYYLVDRDCGGDSPRLVLGLDLDGDGSYDSFPTGSVGPPPSFVGCTPNSWEHEDMTDSVARWHVGGGGAGICPLPYSVPWSDVLTCLDTLYPDHRVLSAWFVDDSYWMPAAAGVVYYDNVEIGGAVLGGP